jgi:DNA-directed RNA polymerase subunit RPC12/RpoP
LYPIDFARDYCAHCGARSTPGERFAWIVSAEVVKRERKAKAKVYYAEAERRLCTEPPTAKSSTTISVYSVDGNRQLTAIKYALAVRWVASGIAHWIDLGADGTALRLRELLPFAELPWLTASITAAECRENALKSLHCVPSLVREKVDVWAAVGVDPQFGEPTKAPMLVWGHCQNVVPGFHAPNERAISFGAAQAAFATIKTQPTDLVADFALPSNETTKYEAHNELVSLMTPESGVPGALGVASRVIRSFRKFFRPLAAGVRPGAIHVRVVSRDDLAAMTVPQLYFFDEDEKVNEIDVSSEGRATLLADCEGDKSVAGEVLSSAESITANDETEFAAVKHEVQCGDTSDYGGNEADAGGDRFVSWECDECWRQWNEDIDTISNSCPYCESTEIKKRADVGKERYREDEPHEDEEEGVSEFLVEE